MFVPDEVPFDTGKLELVVVQLRNNFGLPLLGKQSEFLGEVDRCVAHRDSEEDSGMGKAHSRNIQPGPQREVNDESAIEFGSPLKPLGI